MSNPRSAPIRRWILGIGLALAGVPAVLAGAGVGSFGATEAPTPAAASAAATPATPAPELPASLPWGVPAPVTATSLPWAEVATPEPTPVQQAPARPVHVRLDRLGISSDLMRLGLNPDGTVEVPPSGRHAPAGWYDGSVPPGEVGSAVILGHVDSVYGPGVFYRLRHTRPGDRIEVRRDDGTTAVFTVDRVRTYPRPQFPTDLVYGPLDHAGLRLITCGGPYVKAKGGYQSNVVVFASLA